MNTNVGKYVTLPVTPTVFIKDADVAISEYWEELLLLAVPNKDPVNEDADIDFKEGLYKGPPASVSIFNCWVPAALEVPKIKGKYVAVDVLTATITFEEVCDNIESIEFKEVELNEAV